MFRENNTCNFHLFALVYSCLFLLSFDSFTWFISVSEVLHDLKLFFFFNLKQAMKCVILGLILAELIFEGKLVFVSSLTNVVSFLVCHLLVALEWGSQEVPHPPKLPYWQEN